MPDRRVAITGIGMVSAAGVGVEPFWQSLCEGRSSIKTLALFDSAAYPTQIAGEVSDFSARNFVHVPT